MLLTLVAYPDLNQNLFCLLYLIVQTQDSLGKGVGYKNRIWQICQFHKASQYNNEKVG